MVVEAGPSVVYIVTSGDYSDYQIRGVFLDREKADAYLTLIDKGYESSQVEVHDIYSGPVELLRTYEYCCRADGVKTRGTWKEIPTVEWDDVNRRYVYYGMGIGLLDDIAWLQIVQAVTPQHPDAWWEERIQKTAADLLALAEHERLVNGRTQDEINALLGRTSPEGR